MLNFLIITNSLFNIFFGLVCAFISIQFIKNHKKFKQASKESKTLPKTNK